jgi:8-oxo-dGTP diphosphatase
MSDPVPVCCVLLEQDGRVLIAQRPAGKHLAGEWEFPGGKIEANETPAEALTREITEELGCSLVIGDALPVCPHDYGDRAIHLHPLVAQLAPNSPPPRPIEHAALRWLSLEELADFPVAPADQAVVQAYLDYRKATG